MGPGKAARTHQRHISYGCVKYTKTSPAARALRAWACAGFRVDLPLFHVEPCGRQLAPCSAAGCLGAGNEHLGAAGLQPGQHPGLVAAIQLRGQVVEGDDRPFATQARMQSGLGQQDGQGCQLGLPARQRLAAREGGIPDAPVGPMRAGRSEADGAVAIACQQQCIAQR